MVPYRLSGVWCHKVKASQLSKVLRRCQWIICYIISRVSNIKESKLGSRRLDINQSKGYAADLQAQGFVMVEERKLYWRIGA